jgi:hypothetical protein
VGQRLEDRGSMNVMERIQVVEMRDQQLHSWHVDKRARFISYCSPMGKRQLTSAFGTAGEEDGYGLSKLFTSFRVEGTILITSSGGGIHTVEVLDMVI